MSNAHNAPYQDTHSKDQEPHKKPRNPLLTILPILRHPSRRKKKKKSSLLITVG